MKNLSIFFRDTKPFAQLVGLAFLFLIGFILATGLQVLFPTDFSSPAMIRQALATQGVAQLLIFLMPAVLFALLYQGNLKSFLQLNFQGRKWFLALVAMVLFLLLVPANDWITWWNDHWDLGSLETEMRRLTNASKEAIEKMLTLTSFGDLLLQLLVVALVPAVCEEFFFRGAVQQIFRRWFGNMHVAVIVTAILFSLAHGDLYGLVPRFVLGLILGYLFFLSGSMLVNVCAHFCNNALIVVLYYLYHQGVLATSPDTPLLMPWLTTLLCTLAAVALFILYFSKNDPKNHPQKTI